MPERVERQLICSACKRVLDKMGETHEPITFGTFPKPGMIAPALPAIICLYCGTVQFIPKSLEIIKEHHQRGESRIVTP